MAHYAILNETNIVINVITGVDENELIDGLNPEQWYSEHFNAICKRTSYNTHANTHLEGGIPYRGNYAGIGFLYDPIEDVFIPPQPYPSWNLNKNIWFWEPPIPCPKDGKPYSWDETTLSWIADDISEA